MSQHWAVRAITHPTADTDLALLVTFDNAKYLFNCGEGTQRAFVQSKISLRKLQGVFVTGDGEDVTAGLPGILMSAADAGVKQTVIAGPEGLYQYLASCRTFVQRDSLTVTLPQPAPATHEIHKTASITIKAVPITANHTDSSSLTPSLPSSGAFHWKDRKVRLNELTDVQLRWWRRLVISDMFGGWQRYARQTAGPAVPGDVPSETQPEDHRSSPARFHMPQAIPRKGTDVVAGTSPSLSSNRMAYILQAPPVRGKFNADKARALGVPSGPIRGKLTKGETIEVDDPAAEGSKRVIRPEDVLGETIPGAVCIVVDIAPEHVRSLVEHEAFRPYMQSSAGQDQADHQTHLVIHRATQEVMQDPRYINWMQSFGSTVHHLVADPSGAANEVSFSSAAWNLLRMSQLDSAIFKPPIGAGAAAVALTSDNLGCQILRKGLSVKMHPPQIPEQLSEHPNNPSFPFDPKLQRSAVNDLASKNARYLHLTTEAKQKVHQTEAIAAENAAQDDTYGMTVVPLGTGSAVPSKYRNVSSTLIHVPGFGHMLLDAGEGTLGQLRRRYGSGLTDQVYKSLRFIFISHMHADHHLGLRRVLVDWQAKCPNQILYLVGPSYIWLHLVESGIELDGPGHPSSIRYMDCFHLARSRMGPPSVAVTEFQEPGPSRQERTLAAARECMQDLGLVELQAPVVTHRGRAHGLVLTHTSGWKVAYSGDTTPCQALVEAGKDATLLIHEATLEDDKPEMALAKGHSTFGQAIEVGTQMGAKYLLLNHFSQRYPKLPRIQPAAPGDNDRHQPIIALAFDLMTLPLASFWKMTHYTEALEELFSEVEAAESEAGSEVSAERCGSVPGKQGKGKQGKGEKGKPQADGAAAAAGASQKRKLGEANGNRTSKVDVSATGLSPLAKRTKSSDSDVAMPAA